MDDLISRQRAIDAMAELQGRASTKAELKGISKAWKMIKQLPPAQPLTAYVISDEDGNIKCSNCGSFECWGNFCMDCGAKMRGENDAID